MASLGWIDGGSGNLHSKPKEINILQPFSLETHMSVLKMRQNIERPTPSNQIIERLDQE